MKLDNEISQKALKLLKKLENKINNDISIQKKEENKTTKEIPIYIAGGVGVNFHTGERPSFDIDMEFPSELYPYIDQDLKEEIEDRFMYFDTNYNSTFGLLHEDYLDNVMEIPFDDLNSSEQKTFKLKPYVFSPVDLAITKLARYSTTDHNDIINMFEKKLFSLEDFKKKATEAIDYFVGNQNFVKINLNEILEELEQIKSLELLEEIDEKCKNKNNKKDFSLTKNKDKNKI